MKPQRRKGIVGSKVERIKDIQDTLLNYQISLRDGTADPYYMLITAFTKMLMILAEPERQCAHICPKCGGLQFLSLSELCGCHVACAICADVDWTKAVTITSTLDEGKVNDVQTDSGGGGEE